MANAWRGKGQAAFKIDDFLPKYGVKRIKPRLRDEFRQFCAMKGMLKK